MLRNSQGCWDSFEFLFLFIEYLLENNGEIGENHAMLVDLF